MRTDANLTKFTLTSEKNTNGGESFVLRKDGKICSCPFRNPTILPHPSIQGQMIIQNPICSDGCQFFEFTETYSINHIPEKGIVELSCSKKRIDEVLIEKEKKSDESRPQDSPIIRL
jgi:hypothetical protein